MVVVGVFISLFTSPYAHLGDSVSFFSMLRWKSEGPRQTARFIGVIWFSSTKEVTSRRKKSNVCRTSLFSSGINKIAALTACNLCSFGTSKEKRK